MIVNLREILKTAEDKKIGIGAFNTPNFECLCAVLNAAETLDLPVIISHAELHEKLSPLSAIGPAMVLAAERSKVPVCVHLDHCKTMDYLEYALNLGFTGVMYDGSDLPFEENIRKTKEAVKIAAGYNCGVEGELGYLSSKESGASGSAEKSGPVYTDPDEAVLFCKETGIDALAPSFGTAHGIYKSKPILDLGRVKDIHALTGLPLVMHGGSGVSPEDYKKGIRNGLRKINYYSYMARTGAAAVKELLAKEEVTYFHDMALAAEKAMEAEVLTAMKIFADI